MRISDWSSDVCSSDLPPTSPTRTIWLRPISSRCWPNGSSDGQAAERKTRPCDRREPGYRRRHRRGAGRLGAHVVLTARPTGGLEEVEEPIHAAIGRASCRERVCQYV